MNEPTRYAMNLLYANAKYGRVNDAKMVQHSTGLYIEYSDYAALRKHAEALHEAGEAFSAMIGTGNMPTEKLYRRVITAQAALEAYRAAYPKEDSDAR